MVITTTLILQFVIPAIVTFVVGFIAKKIPREKIVKFIMPYCINAGRLTSKYLMVRFSRMGFDNVIDGIIITILDVLSNAIGFYRDGILGQNEEQIDKLDSKIEDDLKKEK
jgi:hypothetical protein